MSEVITPVTVIGDSAIGGTATVDSGDIAVVAGNLQAVDIVSNNIDSVITDANNIASINTVAASNTQILNLNTNISTIETVNSKLTEINRYYTTFLGASATDPTVRLDGAALQVGDMYYSTALPGMKVRAATTWEASNGTLLGTSYPIRSTFTATAGQTLFTVSGGYTANQLDVFQNGTKLVNAVDVVVSSGTTFTLTVPATAGDTLEAVGLTAADTISGSLRFQSGTEAAPSISAIGDTNTGVFFPAADTIAVTTQGTERLRINSSGSLLIGTTVDTTGGLIKIRVSDGTINSAYGYKSGGVEYAGTITNHPYAILTNNAERLRIDSSGRVGIGTTSVTSGYVLDSRGWIRAQHPSGDCVISAVAGNTTGVSAIYFGDSASDNPGSIEYNHTSNSIVIFTNGTEALRVNSSGNVGIGTTSPAAKLHVDGTIRYTSRPAAGTITALGFDTNGDLKAASSSLRYKHDVQDYEKGLSDLMQLRPVSFKFNGETRKNSGFIAEEVNQLGLDEVMLYDGENRPDGIIYTNMISLLTKSIQELKLENDSLKSRIEALEAK